MSDQEQTRLLSEIRDILEGHHERLQKIDRENEALQRGVRATWATQMQLLRWIAVCLALITLLGIGAVALLAIIAICTGRLTDFFIP